MTLRALVMLSCACSFAQDAPKIDFKTELVEKNGVYSFLIKGTTNLPDNAVLKTVVFYVDEYVGPDGVRNIEGELVHGEDLFGETTVSGGEFQITMYAFRKKPFSIKYISHVMFDPSVKVQGKEVSAALNRMFKNLDKVDATYEFSLGKEGDFEREMQASAADLKNDLTALRVLHKDVKSKFNADIKPADWQRVKSGFEDSLNRIFEKNKDRLEVWKNHFDRKGKMSVAMIVEVFDRLLRACDDYVNDRTKEKLLDVNQRMIDVERRILQELEFYNFDAPDPEEIMALVAEIETLLKSVESCKTADDVAKHNSAMTIVLFKLARSGGRHTHMFVQEITELWTSLTTGESADIKGGCERIHRILDDLKKFAGR